MREQPGLDEHPAGRPVDGPRQGAAAVLIGHRGQGLQVEVQVAWLVGGKDCRRGLARLCLQRLQVAHPWRRRQRSSPERKTGGWTNSRLTASRSSSDTSSVLPNSTARISCAGL